jgi:hypothetical protein
MSVVSSLWASVQGDPVFMRRVNGWLAIFWIIMIPISYATGWLHSVVFVSALSLWALVSGHWSAWQAARVEVKQEQEMRRQNAAELPADVVDQLIARTEIQATP